jgi:hypothetical protein
MPTTNTVNEIEETELIAAALDRLEAILPVGTSRADCLLKLLELGIAAYYNSGAGRAERRRAAIERAHAKYAGISTAGFREDQLNGWPE